MNGHQPGPWWIPPGDTSLHFPDPGLALRDPDGLLAIGGDLSPERILSAYRQGIFPWYSDGQPILWWSPDPRTVLFPAHLKISRSLRKTLRKRNFRVTLDQAFDEVIAACAQPRPGSSGTWITTGMSQAYTLLHRAGRAHSVEAWLDDELAGGLYGISIGRVFFGESMFSHRPDASKVAFVHLVHQLESWGFPLLDCQVYSQHLASLGAEEINRTAFLRRLQPLCAMEGHPGNWAFDTDTVTSQWWQVPDQHRL